MLRSLREQWDKLSADEQRARTITGIHTAFHVRLKGMERDAPFKCVARGRENACLFQWLGEALLQQGLLDESDTADFVEKLYEKMSGLSETHETEFTE
eukprot:2496839-Prymnesium_polylepis.1